jgi:hypothetical protein
MTRHSCHTVPPFSERLALARRLIARGSSGLPPHVADQLDAAGRETRVLHDRLMTVLPALQPDRNWRQRLDGSPSDEVRAYLLAALLGCTRVCVHLRRGGPRPAIARLPLHRVDCDRCSATIYATPAEDVDRCDVCTQLGVVVFHPFAVRLGPALLAGDACPTCAVVLGIRLDVAS